MILVLAFQTRPQPPTQLSGVQITKPETTSVSQPQPTAPQSISKARHATTPALSPSSDIEASMEFVMGGQQEAMGNLKAQVSNLQENRERYDRPDINDLKSSRQHAEWTGSILFSVLVTALSLILYFKNFLWTASLPILRREIVGPQQPKDHA
jgi:hypothetical protein